MPRSPGVGFYLQIGGSTGEIFQMSGTPSTTAWTVAAADPFGTAAQYFTDRHRGPNYDDHDLQAALGSDEDDSC